MSFVITRGEELAHVRAMRASEVDRLFVAGPLEGRYVGNAGIHEISWPAANGRLRLVVGAVSRP